jgi:hypothetical protein
MRPRYKKKFRQRCHRLSQFLAQSAFFKLVVWTQGQFLSINSQAPKLQKERGKMARGGQGVEELAAGQEPGPKRSPVRPVRPRPGNSPGGSGTRGPPGMGRAPRASALPPAWQPGHPRPPRRPAHHLGCPGSGPFRQFPTPRTAPLPRPHPTRARWPYLAMAAARLRPSSPNQPLTPIPAVSSPLSPLSCPGSTVGSELLEKKREPAGYYRKQGIDVTPAKTAAMLMRGTQGACSSTAGAQRPRRRRWRPCWCGAP